jgi:hypothetical protein
LFKYCRGEENIFKKKNNKNKNKKKKLRFTCSIKKDSNCACVNKFNREEPDSILTSPSPS